MDDAKEREYQVMRRVLLRAEELGKVGRSPHAGREYFRLRRKDYEAAGEPGGKHFRGLLEWLDADESRL